MFVDTHTHLNAEEFSEDREQVVGRALANGIQRLFIPNVDIVTVHGVLGLGEMFPETCFPMMGLHPCSVKDDWRDELVMIRKSFEGKKYFGIGETGVDLYWDKTFEKSQYLAFEEQVNWAKDEELPIIIHTRNSFDQTYQIVRRNNDNRLKGIFHCFTGTEDDAKKIIELGDFYLGIGGVVTFKNSGLEKALANIDPAHLVLETDSPYLAPVPYRGKRNESSYLIEVAKRLADIYSMPLERIAEITTANALKLFQIN